MTKLALPALTLASLLVACGPPELDEEAKGASSAHVVGGRHENGHEAVGYLAVGSGGRLTPQSSCGATLIAPQVAITAAHCIVLTRRDGIDTYGYGLGATGGEVFRAARVHVHPGYDPDGAERYRHDVAVLILESTPPVTPVEIAPAPVRAQATYVGYGRTTRGDSTVQTGYTDERKSARLRIDRDDGRNVFTTGLDGGLCWGDSGGPLLVGDAVVGVLADFDRVFSCEVGNRMIFTSLDAELDFIDAAIDGDDRGGAQGDDDDDTGESWELEWEIEW